VREEGGDGESVGSEALSLLSYTLRYVSLTDLGRLSVWVPITDEPVYMCYRGGGEGGDSGCGGGLGHIRGVIDFRTAVIRYTQKGCARYKRYSDNRYTQKSHVK
jgi:hypothetical protein